MLHISHRQTTAYHPESNGAVERLHRRLKDALRARAAAATWSEELPFVLLGLRAQPREDTGLSPAEAVLEERWLNGSAPDCKSVVLGSNPAPPQHTANSVNPEVGSHLG